jgi:hypothetical protein
MGSMKFHTRATVPGVVCQLITTASSWALAPR